MPKRARQKLIEGEFGSSDDSVVIFLRMIALNDKHYGPSLRGVYGHQKGVFGEEKGVYNIPFSEKKKKKKVFSIMSR